MSAEILKEAAALMRSRAETATESPWTTGPHLQRVHCTSVFAGRSQDGHYLAMYATPVNGTHIASWHPAVALAVADWLTRAADRHHEDGKEWLMLHLDSDESCELCEDDGHEVPVCGGCFPTWEGEQARAVWPCVEFKDALAVASAYLGRSA